MEDSIEELFRAALAAKANAYVPYSKFPVGAAVRDDSGRVFSGCNVENAAYPEGICAEASAIGAMVAAGGRLIVEVLTVGDGEAITTCCGGCRQKLREFAAADTPVCAAGPGGVRATFTLGELLPTASVPSNSSERSECDLV